jgi:hypothetical protein
MNIVVVADSIDLSHGGGVGSFLNDLCEAFAEQRKHSIYLIGIVGKKNDDKMCLELKRKK